MASGRCALALLLLAGAPQDLPKGALERRYAEKSAAEMAQQFENDARPVWRYRVAIAGLLQLKPGMTAAEIGAGSGFIARLMAQQVGPDGRVVATDLQPKMVGYMNERARAEGLANFTAIEGTVDATGLDPASVDAIAVVNAFSVFEKQAEMARSIAAALKPGGLLLVVDSPREGQGATATGIDVDDLIRIVTAAGLIRQNENGIVPGQYAVRFRKP